LGYPVSRQTVDPDYSDPDLDEYRQQEWHRRKYGVWFWNEGELVYITGPHYYYLAHVMLDTGYPKFRHVDKDYYYFRGYVVEDPNCFGMVETTQRRGGKTFRGGEFVVEYVSRNKASFGGIQSKTDSDAKKLFRKAVVNPFAKLVDFFKPIYDTSKGDRPTRELSFFNTNKRGHRLEDQERALESAVDFAASTAIAYDGSKLHRYLHDECFKREDSVYDVWEIVQPCLDDGNGNIIGKALFTSTVEEMNDAAMRENVQLWLDSDQSNRNENGRTVSGLYRFFTPAYKVRNVNKYGYCDELENIKFFEAERKARSKDSKKLAAYKRKFPFNWKEAFATSSGVCLYDVIALGNRKEAIIDVDTYIRGNLKWIDREDWSKGCEFVEHPHGKFKFCATDLPVEDFNTVLKRGSAIVPKFKRAGIIGADPYDHDIVKHGTGSKGAGAAYRMKGSKPDDFYDDNFIMIYNHRPPKARMYYEDMAKMAVFTGYKVLAETNKPGLIKYFEEKMMAGMLQRVDGNKEPGIAASTKSHIDMIEHTEDFIIDHSHKVMFVELIEDWEQFDPKNTQDYDLAMASGWALYGANDIYRRLNFESNRKSNIAKKVIAIKKRIR
jgi:hypothetical protein